MILFKNGLIKLGSLFCVLGCLSIAKTAVARVTNPIVDTGQRACYDNNRQISCPSPSDAFWGQDGNYSSNPPSYRDNGDGTVTDLVTGLMWSKSVSKTKLSLVEAEKKAKEMMLGGHDDWRVPNIKELYSLINFSGNTGLRGRGGYHDVPSDAVPFINTDYFDFRYGDTGRGERYIDAQWLSSTRYVSTTMRGNPTLFGVNFADGRIKGYPNGVVRGPKGEKKYYVRYVRGSQYGVNHFVDNGDGTVTDEATGLMWMQSDSEKPMNWQQALEYAEKFKYAGHSDWRLPNAKELQYLVDYSRSPDTTDSAAIDPVFQATSITNEAGQKDYPFYWTSTTHQDDRIDAGVYVCFGRGIGMMNGRIMDVHGAGAQRSDPKTGGAYLGHGPQGDAVRVNNYVRLVRGGTVTVSSGISESSSDHYPDKVRVLGESAQSTPSSQQFQPIGQAPFGDQAARPENGFQNGPPPRRGGAGEGERFIKRLDRDGDNKVSRSEFDGPPQQFSRFDTNGDGYISMDEAPTGPPPRRQR
jgi:Protein of unknown function (DUF1566)